MRIIQFFYNFIKKYIYIGSRCKMFFFTSKTILIVCCDQYFESEMILGHALMEDLHYFALSAVTLSSIPLHSAAEEIKNTFLGPWFQLCFSYRRSRWSAVNKINFIWPKKHPNNGTASNHTCQSQTTGEKHLMIVKFHLMQMFAHCSRQFFFQPFFWSEFSAVMI